MPWLWYTYDERRSRWSGPSSTLLNTRSPLGENVSLYGRSHTNHPSFPLYIITIARSRSPRQDLLHYGLRSGSPRSFHVIFLSLFTSALGILIYCKLCYVTFLFNHPFIFLSFVACVVRGAADDPRPQSVVSYTFFLSFLFFSLLL